MGPIAQFLTPRRARLATSLGVAAAIACVLVVAEAVGANHTSGLTRAQVQAKVRRGHRWPVGGRPAHQAVSAGSTALSEQGVTLSPATLQAPVNAGASGVSTATDAVASLRSLPAAVSVFGPSLASGNPTATRFDVTESEPQNAGVVKGAPYPAWVVSVSGPPVFSGIGSPPPAGTTCDDIGIYDLEIDQWTELLQSC